MINQYIDLFVHRFSLILTILVLHFLHDSFVKASSLKSDVFLNHLTSVDFLNAKWIIQQQWFQKSHVNRSKLFRPGRFQGDIVGHIPSRFLKTKFQTPVKPGKLRSAATHQGRLWPQGRIPYVISSQYNMYARAQLAAAMGEYHRKTCIRFVPRTTEVDFLNIFPGDGCYSGFGRQGGQQDSSLDNDCIRSLGIVIHELMHNVGFLHEHSRPDRDRFVTIMWHNIQPDYVEDFRRHDDTSTLDLPYDYQSIMHYGQKDFSVNGQSTIVPTLPGALIGQESGLSQIDVQKVNKLYGCSSSGGPSMIFGGGNSGEFSGKCMDKRTDCAYLQMNNYCNLYPTWVHENCAKTCGLCGGGGGGGGLGSNIFATNTINSDAVIPCQDFSTFCEPWQQLGYCTSGSYVPFMSQNCRKSCFFC